MPGKIPVPEFERQPYWHGDCLCELSSKCSLQLLAGFPRVDETAASGPFAAPLSNALAKPYPASRTLVHWKLVLATHDQWV